MSIDVSKIKKVAEEEFLIERETAAKGKIKAKLLELDKAKKIVKNLERELEDLEDELSRD